MACITYLLRPNQTELQDIFLEMIKYQSEDQYCDESSYRNMGKTFTVSKKENIFVFRVHDEVTGEWYQSQQLKLEKINQKTIQAAFNPEINAVRYQLLPQSSNTSILSFIIKIQHISTQFKQDITLSKIPITKHLQMKLHYNQVKKQLSKMSDLLSNQLTSSNDALVFQTGYFDSTSGSKYEFQAKKGKYILNVTGYYLYQDPYNGDCENQCYDDNGNFINPPEGGITSPPLIVSIHVGNHMLEELTSTAPCFVNGYQYHFAVSTILKLDKQENVKLLFRLQNQAVFNITQCLISAMPFNYAL